MPRIARCWWHGGRNPLYYSFWYLSYYSTLLTADLPTLSDPNKQANLPTWRAVKTSQLRAPFSSHIALSDGESGRDRAASALDPTEALLDAFSNVYAHFIALARCGARVGRAASTLGFARDVRFDLTVLVSGDKRLGVIGFIRGRRGAGFALG